MSIQFSAIPKSLLSEPISRFLNRELEHLYPGFSNQELIGLTQEIAEDWNQIKRANLVDLLRDQHASLTLTQKQQDNLLSLSGNDSFTLITGQQIHPFLGPAFVWAKVQTTILRAKALSDELQKKIVPVFWMASEDHDFEEISKIPFLGKEYIWSAEIGGPVGDLDTKGIAEILETMKVDFQNDARVLEFLNRFEGIYGAGISLSVATRLLVHRVFGEDGLLIVDPKDTRWKSQTKDIWLRELTTEPYEALTVQAELMKDSGLKLPITPRQTSMFYYGNNSRLRIDRVEEGSFQTSDAAFTWSQQDLEAEIKEHPEKFSANALLRPAYQQRILPNIMYIGGPAECIYWLQIPELIKTHKGSVPALELRTMMAFVPENTVKKIKDFQWDLSEWFQAEELLLKAYIEKEQGELALSHQIELLQTQYEFIRETLYKIKHPELKQIKKHQDEGIRMLKKAYNEFIDGGLESHLKPKINQIKQLKSTVFNEVAPLERKQFWMEWEFKRNGLPQLAKLEGPFLWIL